MSEALTERELATRVYIRVCRDSGHTIPYPRAAALAGELLGMAPMQVLAAVGSLLAMQEIASGHHPCLQLERYK